MGPSCPLNKVLALDFLIDLISFGFLILRSSWLTSEWNLSLLRNQNRRKFVECQSFPGNSCLPLDWGVPSRQLWPLVTTQRGGPGIRGARAHKASGISTPPQNHHTTLRTIKESKVICQCSSRSSSRRRQGRAHTRNEKLGRQESADGGLNLQAKEVGDFYIYRGPVFGGQHPPRRLSTEGQHIFIGKFSSASSWFYGFNAWTVLNVFICLFQNVLRFLLWSDFYVG